MMTKKKTEKHHQIEAPSGMLYPYPIIITFREAEQPIEAS